MMKSTPKINRRICVMGYRAVGELRVIHRAKILKGKSTITIQYVENHFVDSYNPTIENTFHKIVRYKGVDYSTEILDTAGQDEFSIFQKHYSVGIHGYILVYSVNSRKSLDIMKVINDKILNAVGVTNPPRVIVGNKTDLHLERKISREEGEALAREWNCAFIESSGKLNENIEEIFTTMIAEIEKEAAVAPQQPAQQKTCPIV